MKFLRYFTVAVALLFVFGLSKTSRAEMIRIFGPVYVAMHANNHHHDGEHKRRDGEHRKDHRGHDNEKKAEFTFAATPGSKGVMIVKNGGDTGKRHRVSSMEIELNDKEIASERHFNKNVEEMSYDIDLLADNELEVEIKSCKGCEVEITVLGERPGSTLTRGEMLNLLLQK